MNDETEGVLPRLRRLDVGWTYGVNEAAWLLETNLVARLEVLGLHLYPAYASEERRSIIAREWRDHLNRTSPRRLSELHLMLDTKRSPTTLVLRREEGGSS